MATRNSYLNDLFNNFINYEDKLCQDRLNNINKFLVEADEYLLDFYDKRINVNINRNERLSSYNSVSTILTKLADYILSSDDVKKDFKLEGAFEKYLRREIPFSFLFREQDEEKETNDVFLNNMILRGISYRCSSKNLAIVDVNYQKMQAIAHYKKAIKHIEEKMSNCDCEISRFKLSKVKGQLLNDIEDLESSDKKYYTYESKNFFTYYNKQISLYDLFDFEKKNVSINDLKAFKFLLILNKIKIESIELVHLKEDFNYILREIKLKDRHKKIIYHLSEYMSQEKIGEILGFSKSYISKNIKYIITEFKNYYLKYF